MKTKKLCRFPKIVEIISFIANGLDVDINVISKDISDWKKGIGRRTDSKKEILETLVDKILLLFFEKGSKDYYIFYNQIAEVIREYQLIINEVEVHNANEEDILWTILSEFLIRIIGIKAAKLEKLTSINIVTFKDDIWFLPTKSKGKIKYPINRLFNWWKKIAGFETWEELKKNFAQEKNLIKKDSIDLDSAKTEINRWLNQDKIPNSDNIESLSKIKFTNTKGLVITNVIDKDKKLKKLNDFVKKNNLSLKELSRQLILSEISIADLLKGIEYTYSEVDYELFPSRYGDFNEDVLKRRFYWARLVQYCFKKSITYFGKDKTFELIDLFVGNYIDTLNKINNQQHNIESRFITEEILYTINSLLFHLGYKKKEYNKIKDIKEEFDQALRESNIIKAVSIRSKLKKLNVKREMFLSGLDILDILTDHRREKEKDEEKILEKVFDELRGNKLYNKVYDYQIDFYYGKYQIQLGDFKEGLKYYKKAFNTVLYRGGRYQKYIIIEGLLLAAYQKKWKLFKKLYRQGIEQGYYNLYLKDVESYIIRDYKKMFLNYFAPQYYFKIVSKYKIKVLKEEQRNNIGIDINEWESKKFGHANQSKKGTGPKKMTPLMMNSLLGNEDEVRKWLEQGADMNEVYRQKNELADRFEDSSTALIMALQNKYLKIFELLFQDSSLKQETINIVTKKKSNSILSLAIQYGLVDIVQRLIDKEVNVHQKIGFNYNYPLSFIVSQGTTDDILDYYNNCIYGLSAYKASALYFAILNLRPVPLVINLPFPTPIVDNCKDKYKIMKIIDNILEVADQELINDTNRYNNTPLMLACEFGEYKLVKKLLELGVDIKTKNNFGFSAIEIAESYKHNDVADLIREYE